MSGSLFGDEKKTVFRTLTSLHSDPRRLIWEYVEHLMHNKVLWVFSNGRFSRQAKDGFMIFDSWNLKKLSSIEPSIFVCSVLLMEAVYIIHPACWKTSIGGCRQMKPLLMVFVVWQFVTLSVTIVWRRYDMIWWRMTETSLWVVEFFFSSEDKKDVWVDWILNKKVQAERLSPVQQIYAYLVPGSSLRESHG